MSKLEYLDQPLDSPVLFIVFRRPDTTRQVFERIRKAKPKRLFIAANAPKTNDPAEIKKVEEVRRIVESVDWDCKVERLYRDKHLNAKTSISSAIDWFFENVEEGIILEDDCVPHLTFFRFCAELLEKYRDDERIMMISGDNFQFGHKRTQYSYYFSQHCHIWGWASWRRAWKNYDVSMKLWPQIRDEKWLHDILYNKKAIKYWTQIFENVYQNEIDTWDYQWVFACWAHGGITILPSSNLVSNIGFGPDATHVKENGDSRANMAIYEMAFPLKHPPFLIRDAFADEFTNDKFVFISPIKRIAFRIKEIQKWIK